MILGRQFFDSQALNILAVLLEIAAFTGVYASPAIIWRFGVRQKPVDKKTAKIFTIIFAIAFIALMSVIIWKANLSILPIITVAIWTYFSYGILVYDENEETNFVVKLFAKFSEVAVYIIVGVITTVVAWGVYYLCSLIWDLQSNALLVTLATVLNWSAGILVSYPLNRWWVFHSHTKGKEMWKEFVGFVASRLSTLAIEEVIMVVCVNILKIDQYISKYVIASIVVIILNYVFAKIFVFKNRENKES